MFLLLAFLAGAGPAFAPSAQSAPPAPADLATLLSRVAREAGLLRQYAPKSLSEETLVQRTIITATPRIRIGASATQPAKTHTQTKQVVSEYTIAPLKGSEPPALVEFREVVSVDGTPVRAAEEARHALSLDIRSPTDRLRKRMLENFASHGLVDIATDYALVLLAFTAAGQKQLRIAIAGQENVGPDPALVLDWSQTSPDQGELLFAGKQAARQALQGKLYVRNPDGLPLRIQVWASHPIAGGHTIRDEATVDYAMSPHGLLTPISVRHLHLVDGQLRTENLYRYAPFRIFGAASGIKFSPVPDDPPGK